LSLLAAPSRATAADQREATVGMPAKIDGLLLPGSELEAKPLDRKAPVVLRVLNTYPHGTLGFRYDLEWYGLEPGTFDLREALRRKDGSPTGDVPPIKVQVNPLLPPGQVVPNAVQPHGTPSLGGYQTLLIAGGVVWVVGLLAILLLGRRKRRAEADESKPLTVADRLRPLVEKAMAGQLSLTEQAALERTLLAFWRTRLHLEHTRPVEAIGRLRAHPEAGALLNQLEAWLHRPAPANESDVATLLRPYRHAPANELSEASR
jgi:hypothetical protein